MSYHELIKDFSRIRNYMREFFVYGFKSREEYKQKSTRSYDNERRRIESWLSDYMSFHQDGAGKSVFISVDSRHISRNPLYTAWKTASFTKNDISLHFLLLDILLSGEAMPISEIMAVIDQEYLQSFADIQPLDVSTLRKKLREYEEIGLVCAEKKGKQRVYRLADDRVNLEDWQDIILFFSEENPLGVIGSYLLDKLMPSQDIFSFKHRYLLFTLDSGVMLDLLSAIQEQRKVELELFNQGGKHLRRVILPMKIFISTQGGRQYLAGFNIYTKKLQFHRLDMIQKARLLDKQTDYELYKERLKSGQAHIWGVTTSDRLEHIEMTLSIDPMDVHIIHRLEREKRCGAVQQINETTWRFSADVYDALELLPWLRTFIGRIENLICSNKGVEEKFWSDFALLAEMYGGDGDAV